MSDRRQPPRRGAYGDDRRDQRRDTRGEPPRKPVQLQKGGAELPRWVREELVRVTPKDRRDAALQLLTSAAVAFSEGRFRAAMSKLLETKSLSPRTATVRELLGLSAYRTGQWKVALSELRTFRRLTGDTTHMPVEMDSLRALGRAEDVTKAWELWRELGGSRQTEDEARVVYASFLLDQGDARKAWSVIKPGKLIAQPGESELRRWYVAARVAAALDDRDAGRQVHAGRGKGRPGVPWVGRTRATARLSNGHGDHRIRLGPLRIGQPLGPTASGHSSASAGSHSGDAAPRGGVRAGASPPPGPGPGDRRHRDRRQPGGQRQ